jgi:hypothetical protein
VSTFFWPQRTEPGHKDLKIGPSFFHLPLFSFQRSKAPFQANGISARKKRPENSERVVLLLFPADGVNLFLAALSKIAWRGVPRDNRNLYSLFDHTVKEKNQLSTFFLGSVKEPPR